MQYDVAIIGGGVAGCFIARPYEMMVAFAENAANNAPGGVPASVFTTASGCTPSSRRD